MRRTRVNRTCLIIGGLSALFAAGEESPSEIGKKSREKGALNLVGLSAELKLITTSAGGHRKEQALSSSAKKIDGRIHSVARFSSPPAVAGVVVLTIEGKRGEPSEISLYLPKLHRVRRVARSQQAQSFMETDFNYADLAASNGARDEAQRRLPDETMNGKLVYVLEGMAPPESPYGLVRAYIDQETYVPLRIDYKDKDGKPLKAYRTVRVQRYRDRPLAAEATMQNLQTGSNTTLELIKVDESRLGDEAFSERALERG